MNALPADTRIDVSKDDPQTPASAEIPGARKDAVRGAIGGNDASISARLVRPRATHPMTAGVSPRLALA